MQQQGDGTRPEPRPLLEEDRRWLEEALKSAMIDLNQRMKDIKETLEAGEGAEGAADAAAAEGGGAAANVSLQDKERLLDELMDIVETIDLARGALRCCCWPAWGVLRLSVGGGATCDCDCDFYRRHQGGCRRSSAGPSTGLPSLPPCLPSAHCCPTADLQTIGGLQTLLELLGSPHPSLRWRAAEVAATCVQNNPPTQVGAAVVGQHCGMGISVLRGSVILMAVGDGESWALVPQLLPCCVSHTQRSHLRLPPNPPKQEAFLKGGIMPRLLPLLHDDNATVQTKACLAIR